MRTIILKFCREQVILSRFETGLYRQSGESLPLLQVQKKQVPTDFFNGQNTQISHATGICGDERVDNATHMNISTHSSRPFS
jgi:hypothetical protein